MSCENGGFTHEKYSGRWAAWDWRRHYGFLPLWKWNFQAQQEIWQRHTLQTPAQAVTRPCPPSKQRFMHPLKQPIHHRKWRDFYSFLYIPTMEEKKIHLPLIINIVSAQPTIAMREHIKIQPKWVLAHATRGSPAGGGILLSSLLLCIVWFHGMGGL